MKKRIAYLILIAFPLLGFAQKITPIGTGLTLEGEVYDLITDEDNDILYAVGYFSAIDGVKMEKVGYAIDDEWLALSDQTEIDGYIFCATTHNGVLYIGGNFTISTDIEIKNVAKFENGGWKPVGIDFINGPVHDLEWFENSLYMTGDFTRINSIDNKGVLKFHKEQWKDAGLHKGERATGLIRSDNSLYAWGNASLTLNGASHSVSILTDDQWTSLPDIEPLPSAANGCMIYQDELYINNNNSLYRFNTLSYSWELLATLPEPVNNAILFGHQGEICVVYRNSQTYPAFSRFYRLEDGELIRMEFQAENKFLFDKVNVVSKVNGRILVGGQFIHQASNSVSLSTIKDEKISSYGQVSSRNSYKTTSKFAVGSSMTKYHDTIVIAGTFTFTNETYSPNIVYWDGNNFIPFPRPLPSGVRQIEVFENELYALPRGYSWESANLSPYTLIKFNGTNWEGVDAPEGNRMTIINDKLFITNDKYNDSSGEGPPYLQNGTWQSLKSYPIEGLTGWYQYSELFPYLGGYIMLIDYWPVGEQLVHLPNDSSEWEVIEDSISVRFDYFVSFDDKNYLTDLFDEVVYKIKEGQIQTVLEEVDIESPYFFYLENDLYYSAWNESTYRLTPNNSFEPYNSIRIRDTEKIDDQQYLFASQSRSYSSGLESKAINGIGILSFEPLSTEMKKDKEISCQNSYIQYWPETEHANVSYQWKFEGGSPAISTALYPMIKYHNAGTFKASLRATNLDGDTVYTETEVVIENCSFPESRAHNYDNHWMMGYEYSNGKGLGGFDFSHPETIFPTRNHSPENINNGSVVMSNAEGKLQFYSNGISIWNWNNSLMKGSSCFNEDLENYSLDYLISNQSILSLPAVNKENIYYVFDLNYQGLESEYWPAANNLSMTTIDMNQDNGLGAVIDCNEVILSDILLNSTMQATQHKNGKDWWIIVGKHQSDEYYKLLLTEDGIESVETANWERYYDAPFRGQSTFSPDGRFFAQVIQDDQEISIWRFDNENGVLSDRQVYTLVANDEYENPYGCAFSPDSKFLYVSSLSHLRQIDLCNYDEIEVEIIDTWDGSFEFIYPLFFGKLMLAPNQQIIVTPYGNSHRSFGVIEQPNEKGLQCLFKQHALQIPAETRNTGNVIPIFPHFRDYPSAELECTPVSTKPIENITPLSIYPNPVGENGLLHLSQTASGYIYDSNGKRIFSFQNADYLDIHALHSGIYFIQTDKGSHRFVKQ
ncbi:MAG: T9SS type A sorting domain-containing protein [Saprospiraceae bacterium]|nr:T9SS type A sorting domain-containing protein [Saprospiraceae bacterium]